MKKSPDDSSLHISVDQYTLPLFPWTASTIDVWWRRKKLLEDIESRKMEITNIDGDLPISKQKLLLSWQRKKMCQFWHRFCVKRWIPDKLISNLCIGWTIDIGYQGQQDGCHHEIDGCAKWGAEMSSLVLYRTLRCDWRIFEGSQLPPEETLPLWVGTESYQSIGCKNESKRRFYESKDDFLIRLFWLLLKSPEMERSFPVWNSD